MKRYQNPDIFEHLAMSYVLGTLQGKARQRFEALQARHLYLRAVTAAYQQRFAPLAQLLPEEPPPARVWDGISRKLALEQPAAATFPRWWNRYQDWLPWAMTAFASVTAAVITVLLLNVDTQPDVYMATLKSASQQDKMLVAMVYHDRLEVAFDMPANALPAENNMMPTLWGIHKDKTHAPMRVGELSADDHRFQIDRQTWRSLAEIKEFAISMEPMDKPPADKPLGKVMFTGKLQPM